MKEAFFGSVAHFFPLSYSHPLIAHRPTLLRVIVFCMSFVIFVAMFFMAFLPTVLPTW